MSNDKYVSPLSEALCKQRDAVYFFTGYEGNSKHGESFGSHWLRQRKELGLNITQEQIDELKAHADDINYDVAKAREKKSVTML